MSKVDFPDLRKHMISAALESPALGSVTCHVEIERLFSHFITSTQAEITLPDIERVAQHYGYNRDFAKRCFENLKRGKNKLGSKELWITLSLHLEEVDDDIIKFISEQLSFPHLYRYPGDRRGGKVYGSMQQIIVKHTFPTLALPNWKPFAVPWQQSFFFCTWVKWHLKHGNPYWPYIERSKGQTKLGWQTRVGHWFDRERPVSELWQNDI